MSFYEEIDNASCPAWMLPENIDPEFLERHPGILEKIQEEIKPKMEQVIIDKKYDKLQKIGKTAILLYSSYLNLSVPQMREVYKPFLKYDLSVNNKQDHDLPDGIYILSLFKDTESNTLFTVLKPGNQENNIKYFGSVGKEFEVKISE